MKTTRYSSARVEALEARITPGSAISPNALGLTFVVGHGSVFALYTPTFGGLELQDVRSAAGLNGPVVGDIDYRPATGELYASTNASLFKIDLAAETADVVGFPIDLPTVAGFLDFNPVSGGIRLTNSTGDNYRFNADTGALAFTDSNFNGLSNATVHATAYANNFAGATQTTLYAIDVQSDRLVTIGSVNGTPISPNTGTILSVGTLGVDATAALGFDIVGQDGVGFALLTVGGQPGIYEIDLAMGNATFIGNIGLPGQNNFFATGLAVIPAHRSLVAGSPKGGLPLVTVFDPNSTEGPISFLAFERNFRGGVTVATGDIDNDGTPDIIVGTTTGKSKVRVFDGETLLPLMGFFGQGFDAFNGRGKGVSVAAGDVNGDGFADLLVTALKGTSVEIYDGVTTEFTSFKLSKAFGKGATVAAGDLDGDGDDEIVVGSGKGPRNAIGVFDASGTSIGSFTPFREDYKGGVRVAVGDTNGDGKEDIIAGTMGVEGFVMLFDGSTVGGTTLPTELGSVFPFDEEFTGGVFVAAGDVDGDGLADVITSAGPGGGPHVKIYDGVVGNLVESFFAFSPSDPGALANGIQIVGDGPGFVPRDGGIGFKPKNQAAPFESAAGLAPAPDVWRKAMRVVRLPV